MENVSLYLNLLETIKIDDEDSAILNITKLLKTIQSNVNLNKNQTIQFSSHSNFYLNEKCSPYIKYVAYHLYLLRKLKESIINSNEQFETNQLIIINDAINSIIKYGIGPIVSNYFKMNTVTINIEIQNLTETFYFLYDSVLFLFEYSNWNLLDKFDKNIFPTIPTIYGGFCLIYITKHRTFEYEFSDDKKLSVEVSQYAKQNQKLISNHIHESFDRMPVEEGFSILMKMNTRVLTKELSLLVTDDIKYLLTKSNGFYSFVKVLVGSKCDDQPVWKKGEIAARIVAAKGHSDNLYNTIIDEIFQYLCDTSDKHNELVPVYSMTLSRIYFISNESIRNKIKANLFDKFDLLANPNELLTGIVLLENEEFCQSIRLLFKIFCGTSACSMKTVLLISHLPIFFKLFSIMPDDAIERTCLNTIIVTCLANRESVQLQTIIECLLLNKKSKFMKYINSRVNITFINENNKNKIRYNIVIGPSDIGQYYAPVENFLELLKNSNHNIFIYAVFLVLLNLLEKVISNQNKNDINSSSCLLNNQENADDIETFVLNKFNEHVIILNTLVGIISIKGFHSQIYENPYEILEFIKKFLLKQIENPKDVNENILIIIFSILQLFSNNTKTKSCVDEIIDLLRKLKDLNIDQFITNQIRLILNETNHNNIDKNISEYKIALGLCDEKEPFLQVFGLNKIIKLIHENDENVILNKYEILAITIRMLKVDKDSYTYLNCIKLLSTLSIILKREIFDTLIVEFDNETNDIDFRLKIGEAIVKVVETLDRTAYKYKDLLINCFMRGAKNKIDEFRTSSLSNLGTICRIFSYQVHHFFQELMLTINSIIVTDTYLPARRAAIMVLSQLLFGIENIIDFQDYLLPIYRTLKNILITESDQNLLLHAEIGLENLKQKTKKLFFPEEENLEKEIKIFGINDKKEEIKLTPNSNPKIVELN